MKYLGVFALAAMLAGALWTIHYSASRLLQPSRAEAAATAELQRLGYTVSEVVHVNVNDDGCAWVIADCQGERLDVRLVGVTLVTRVQSGNPWGGSKRGGK